MNNNIIWIASFDIGKKNFCFYIEEINLPELLSIQILPIDKRYNNDGTPTQDFIINLEHIYKNGKVILLENIDLTQNCNPKLYLDFNIFYNINNLLDSYENYWNQCDYFIIEQQMSFGKKNNILALKIGQHCWSYFSIKFNSNQKKYSNIIEFPAYYKTQILGSKKDIIKTKNGIIKYKSIDKPKRKKWSIEKALEILSIRNDNDTIKFIKSQKKKDDLADVICQLQAFKINNFFI